jgi:hypothetical protein
VQIVKPPLCTILLSPAASFVLIPDIFVITPFSKKSLDVRDQVQHPYNTTGRSIIQYVLIFVLLSSKRQWNRICSEEV